MSVSRPSQMRLVLVSTAGAAGLLWPVWSGPSRFIPGHPLGDGPKHVWSYWHAPQTWSTWPWTEALNAPAGGLLLDPMALPAFLLSPVSALMGPAFAANLWVWGMLVLTALGVARLARGLGASESGALLSAGLTLCAQPLLAYPLVSGVHERLGVALLPWLAAALMRRARTGRGGWIPALLLGPLALHSGVWAWIGTLMVVASLAMPRAVSLRRFLLPWVVGLVGLAGAFALSRGWSSDPMSLAPQPGRHGLLGPGGAVVRAATFRSLWWPATPAFLEEGDLLCRGEHLGAMATVLGGVGLARRRDGWAAWWAGCIGLLIAWALGPWIWGRLNPVYAVSVWVVPLLGAWPEPGQLTIPAVLLLTAIAGASWSQLDRATLRWGVALLLLVERLVALPELSHRTDTHVSPVFAELPGPGTVVTIPRVLPGRRLAPGVPFLAQISHTQGIAASVFPGVSLWDDWMPIREGVATDWSEVGHCLLRGGQRYVALRVALLDDLDRIVDGLQRAGGTQIQATNDWLVVDLGVDTAPVAGLPPFHPQGAAPAPGGWLPPAPLPVGVHTVERRSETCPVDRVSRPGTSTSE